MKMYKRKRKKNMNKKKQRTKNKRKKIYNSPKARKMGKM